MYVEKKEQLRHVEKTDASKHTSNIAGILRSEVVITGWWRVGTGKDNGRTGGNSLEAEPEVQGHLASGRAALSWREDSLMRWAWMTGSAHQDTVKSALSHQRELFFYSSF